MTPYESPSLASSATQVEHPQSDAPKTHEPSEWEEWAADADAELTLNPDNPLNTTITRADGAKLYVVRTHTDGAHARPRTEVRDTENRVVASVEWHDVRPNVVRLGEKPPVSMGSWMCRSLLPSKSDVTFKDDAGRKYRWTGNEPYKSLELYAESSGTSHPIAWFVPPRRDHPLRRGETPLSNSKIALTPRALEIRDLTVVSFLFLEKTRKERELFAAEKALYNGAVNAFSDMRTVVRATTGDGPYRPTPGGGYV